MRFNVIGAGRLGKNLALSLIHYAHAELIAITNHHLASAHKAVATIAAGHAVAIVTELPAVDLTLITSPDDTIATVAKALAHNPNLLTGSIVAHCSGVLNCDSLKPLHDKGCLIASIHPLKAFPADYLDVNALHDCHCVIEGDDAAVSVLTSLFTLMGAKIIPISSLKKSTYHAAAVMASNYVVTLADCAIGLLIEAGLSDAQAKTVTLGLMQNSINNMGDTSRVANALTGPLVRGDVNTIDAHLQAIHAPSINALYRAAGLATLPLTQLDGEVLKALQQQLDAHD